MAKDSGLPLGCGAAGLHSTQTGLVLSGLVWSLEESRACVRVIHLLGQGQYGQLANLGQGQYGQLANLGQGQYGQLANLGQGQYGQLANWNQILSSNLLLFPTTPQLPARLWLGNLAH